MYLGLYGSILLRTCHGPRTYIPPTYSVCTRSLHISRYCGDPTLKVPAEEFSCTRLTVGLQKFPTKLNTHIPPTVPLSSVNKRSASEMINHLPLFHAQVVVRSAHCSARLKRELRSAAESNWRLAKNPLCNSTPAILAANCFIDCSLDFLMSDCLVDPVILNLEQETRASRRYRARS